MQHNGSSTTKRKRWLIVVIGLLVLGPTVYIKRQGLERAVIAFRLYHAHIFTPRPMPGESGWSRLAESTQFYWDFAGFVMARKARLKQFKPALKPLVKEIVRRQSAGGRDAVLDAHLS